MKQHESVKQSFDWQMQRFEESIQTYKDSNAQLTDLIRKTGYLAGYYRSNWNSFTMYVPAQEMRNYKNKIEAHHQWMLQLNIPESNDEASENNLFWKNLRDLGSVIFHIMDLDSHGWYKDDLPTSMLKKMELERKLSSFSKPSNDTIISLVFIVAIGIFYSGYTNGNGFYIAVGSILGFVSLLVYSRNSKLKEDIKNTSYQIERLDENIKRWMR